VVAPSAVRQSFRLRAIALALRLNDFLHDICQASDIDLESLLRCGGNEMDSWNQENSPENG
jgi:hypothetical protein